MSSFSLKRYKADDQLLNDQLQHFYFVSSFDIKLDYSEIACTNGRSTSENILLTLQMMENAL